MSTGREQPISFQREPPTPIDRWVRHGLQAQFAHVADEPVPEDLLRLVATLPRDD